MGVGMNGSGWRYASASVIGTSHLKQNEPVCQDFSRCGADEKSDREVLLAIAADGAGSAKHSAEGAKVVCEYVAEFFSSFAAGTKPVNTITRETATECISRCQERLTELATARGATSREFACTLLCAIVDQGSCAFFQVGDGAIVVDGVDCDPFNWIFWPDRGEYENTTTFVTQDEAFSHLQFEMIERQIRKLALFTDGIQRLALDLRNHVPYAPFFSALFSSLANCEPGYSERFAENLRNFLGSERVNSRTDDDKTLILAFRD
jgi:hypothetical protein